MYPMKMVPTFKDYLWGGTRLITDFCKQTDLRPVAESWEVSCHPDGLSIIENGIYAGRSLRMVLQEHPKWLGSKWEEEEFPILIKLIDAAGDLSVQVHPDNEYAKRVENQQGKNEMWYVIDAAPGAKMILGCREGVTRDNLRRGIETGTLMELVNHVPVKLGDCFEIPAGMLHAIGAGILLAEVQQNSNVTYRVFDYNRVGADQKKRPLHVEKALDVVRTELQMVNRAEAPLLHLGDCAEKQLSTWDYFSARWVELHIDGEITCSTDGFRCYMMLAGVLTFFTEDETLTLHRGECVFLPAGGGPYHVHADCKALVIE